MITVELPVVIALTVCAFFSGCLLPVVIEGAPWTENGRLRRQIRRIHLQTALNEEVARAVKGLRDSEARVARLFEPVRPELL